MDEPVSHPYTVEETEQTDAISLPLEVKEDSDVISTEYETPKQ